MRVASRVLLAQILILGCNVGCQTGRGPLSEGEAGPTAVTQRSDDDGRACVLDRDCSWWQEPSPSAKCCGGMCSYVNTDALNCGACGSACDPGLVCAAGACRSPRGLCDSATCGPGEICCGGVCTSPGVDRSNCGGCGVTCTFSGSRCSLGTCCLAVNTEGACSPSATCPGNQVLCGSRCTDLSSDPANCGACGRSCSRCAKGLCPPP